MSRKLLLSLGTLFLIVVWAVFGYDWRDAVGKLHYLKSIDLNRIDEYGMLHFKVTPDEHRLLVTETGCLALWQSRSAAVYDLDLAEMVLAKTSECRQEELVALWAGNLAWLQGNREKAVEDWSQLADVQLLELGRSYVLSGDLERGRVLLELVVERDAVDLPVVNRVSLYQLLGGVYESSGDLTESAAQYRKAWDLSGFQYEQAFYLGRVYREQGRCGDAIDVLEAGLGAKSGLLRPQLDSAYYVGLGQCYASLGDGESARHNYALAQEVLDLAGNQSPGAVFPVQRQRIEQLLQALDPKE